MVLAEMAGIEIFGTGGLGGVHRGGESSMDVSADLTELGRTSVTVISSGCKNFLDLPRTLEYLETQGVCVSTFADGREDEVLDIPSFYSRESGVRSPTILKDEREAASIICKLLSRFFQVPAKDLPLDGRRLLRMRAGIFFANPIPAEYSIPRSELNEVIEKAIQEAAEKGYTGSSNTPFILEKIKGRTAERSIPANRAMIESNVRRAAIVAVQLSHLKKCA